jgi:hypothetical protein
MLMSQPTTTPYKTIEEIQLRKSELNAEIQKSSQQIGDLWHELFLPKKASSKGEFIANIISNSITAIDAFLLVKKLINNYGWLIGKKKHKR